MHMAFAGFTSVNPDGNEWLTRRNAEKKLEKAAKLIRTELDPPHTKYLTALYFLVVEALDDYLEMADERARRAIEDLLNNPEYQLNEGFKYMLQVTREFRNDAKALIEYALGKPLEQTITYRLVKRITRDPNRNPWRNVVKNYYRHGGFKMYKDHPWLRGGVEIFVDPDQETIDLVMEKDKDGWIKSVKLVRLNRETWNAMGYSELYVETIKGIFLDQYHWVGELIRTPHYNSRVKSVVGWDVNKLYHNEARKAYEDLMRHMGVVRASSSPFS